MSRPAAVALTFMMLASPLAASSPEPVESPVPSTMDLIVSSALADSSAYRLLEELCDIAGPRPSGSANYEAAAAWAMRRLREAGLVNVGREPVAVPHWVRGDESAWLLEPHAARLTMIGLGGSVGTPPGGLEADVLAVRDFDELEARADEAAGRFVLFDPPWEGYGETVRYRTRGAIAAARHGAVGCLIRSVTPAQDSTPHTGVMRYDEGDTIPRIPAAALSVEDAARLHRQARRGLPVRVHLEMAARWHPDAASANVVAELTGRAHPEKIVLVGGHLDSWDVGCCAHDDGAGCVIAMEAASLLKRMGLQPRRTIRVVLFADEEMTQTGGRTYARDHADELANHVAALESDSGGYPPAGFTVRGDSLSINRLAEMTAPLAALGASEVSEGWGGVDISFLADAGVPLIGHRVHNDGYFDVHHSAADTIDKVDPGALQRNVAAVAALLWALAESPAALR
ncbi:M20/M25/M40 family metallo-hydrolase [bacterium]|nr:M20/M25/M40 family metallo-hydrolase [bacterium]MBU1073143.1 M20/M25/M40 family metallo-hydrolase [bacterium]